jgi:hypothetical protein
MSFAISMPLSTLVVAAVGAVALAGCGVDVDLGDDATRRIENETVPIGDLRMLELSTDNGAVDIRGGGGDEIAVRAVLRERHEGDADYSVEVVGERLVVTGECDGRRWDDCAVGFVVTVPSDFDVEVGTSNGRVELSDLAGDILVETDNGAIGGTRLGSSVVATQTDNGRIGLDFEVAPVSVTTQSDNGAIAIRLPETDDDYDVDARSDNGAIDIEVRIDPAAHRRVTARSDNGAIDVEYRSA